MTVTAKDLVAAAEAVVERVDFATAQSLLKDQGGLLLDVRDSAELAKTGRAAGSHHISRGLLEFKADPSMPSHDGELQLDRPIILHCASGGRAALAGKLLKDMGYQKVFNLGGLVDWEKAGGPLEQL